MEQDFESSLGASILKQAIIDYDKDIKTLENLVLLGDSEPNDKEMKDINQYIKRRTKECNQRNLPTPKFDVYKMCISNRELSRINAIADINSTVKYVNSGWCQATTNIETELIKNMFIGRTPQQYKHFWGE